MIVESNIFKLISLDTIPWEMDNLYSTFFYDNWEYNLLANSTSDVQLVATS